MHKSREQLAHILEVLMCYLRIPVLLAAVSKARSSGMLVLWSMLWNALCSLYGEDKAKTNFPASDYANYLAIAASSMPGPGAEPLANASQLVEELQQVVSPHPLLTHLPYKSALAWRH